MNRREFLASAAFVPLIPLNLENPDKLPVVKFVDGKPVNLRQILKLPQIDENTPIDELKRLFDGRVRKNVKVWVRRKDAIFLAAWVTLEINKIKVSPLSIKWAGYLMWGEIEIESTGQVMVSTTFLPTNGTNIIKLSPNTPQ